MVLEIDGVDITPYIAYQGVQWQRSDIDADEIRTLDGTLRRSRVATKRQLNITCRPLTLEEAALVLSAVMPVSVTVRYTDPQLGREVTARMYSNNSPATFCMRQKDGTEYWGGISFPLTEK